MIRWTWRHAALGLTLSLACGEAAGVPPDSLPNPVGALPSCDASACGALAGPCQVGVCEDQSGACRLSAALEGEPCLEGNACGPALCRSGECSALEPSQCLAGHDEQCQVAMCRPERGGCVNEPLVLPGGTCQTALSLPVVGTSALSASSRCADHARQLPGCSSGLLGPSTHFALDLRGAAAPTQVALVIDADFSFEAMLARGPCGDTVLEACAAPFQRDQRSRLFSGALAPDYYELTVIGRGESDQGTVHVAAAVEPARCSAAPVNDECEAGLALDASLPIQTLIGNAGCGTVSVPNRCVFDPGGDVFYDLDLSRRAAPTLLEVDVAKLDDSVVPTVVIPAVLFSAGEPGCGEPALCGSNFVTRLPPGRYRLGVSQGPDYESSGVSSSEVRNAAGRADVLGNRFALRVRLREVECAETKNDTWQTAIDLDPDAPTQRLVGNTACGTHDVAAGCNADRGAPDLFYRLDLRGQKAPRSIFFAGHSDSDLVAYVLATDAAGVPTRAAACEALAPPAQLFWTTNDYVSFDLAPRLYYLVIDGRIQNAGRFDFELWQEARTVSVKCFDFYTSRCLEDSEPACAESRASPECLSTALECGLDPGVYSAFCARFPGCCDGTGEREECRLALNSNLECN
jgi:hypothetical protein